MDLVFVLGGEDGEILLEESMEVLRILLVKKVLWLIDLFGVKYLELFIFIFDYVFIQKVENILFYGCMSSV